MCSPTNQKSHSAFLPLSPLIHQQTLRDPKAHSIGMLANPKAGWFEGKLLMRHSSLESLSLSWGKGKEKNNLLCVHCLSSPYIHSCDSPSSSSSTPVKKVSELPKHQLNHWSLSIWGKYKSKLQLLPVKWSNLQVLVLIQVRDLNHSFLFTCTFLYTKKTSSPSRVSFPVLSHQQLVNNWHKDRLIPGRADTHAPHHRSISSRAERALFVLQEVKILLNKQNGDTMLDVPHPNQVFIITSEEWVTFTLALIRNSILENYCN